MKNLLIIVFMSLLLVSCDRFFEGKPGISNSIKESKEKKVFYVQKYFVESINYTWYGEQIGVKEAWIEYEWSQGKSSEETVIPEGGDYQFLALLNVHLSENIINSIRIEDSNVPKSRLGIIKSSIIEGNIKKTALPDTIKLDFYLLNKSQRTLIKRVILK